MKIEDIIGKIVTDIYPENSIVDDLDFCECTIELDKNIFIGIPTAGSEEILLKEPKQDAVSLFADLSDIPGYHITYGEDDSNQRKKRSIFYNLYQFLFGHGIAHQDGIILTKHYTENRLKHVKDRRIVDYLWYAEDIAEYENFGVRSPGYILFDNGYLMTEVFFAPHGTGCAGLHVYESINDVINFRGNDYFKLTDKKG